MANSFNDILGQPPRTTLSLVLVLRVKDKKAHEISKVLEFSVAGREPRPSVQNSQVRIKEVEIWGHNRAFLFPDGDLCACVCKRSKSKAKAKSQSNLTCCYLTKERKNVGERDWGCPFPAVALWETVLQPHLKPLQGVANRNGRSDVLTLRPCTIVWGTGNVSMVVE